MSVQARVEWEDLPDGLKDAIEARTGPVASAETVAGGLNSPLAAVIDARDGQVFVKGLPSDHVRVHTQAREADVAPFVQRVSPELLWHFDESGWNVLGFAYLEGRAAGYRPGSPDLDLIVELIESMAGIEVPDGRVPVKYAGDRWRSYVDDPADARVLAGTALIHTDWMPGNVLISDNRAWLCDWAWASLGAPWIDPACWLIQLMARGHRAHEAERIAARIPAYASADPAHVDIFARACARMWKEIAEADGGAWAGFLATAAYEWDDFRQAHAVREGRRHRAALR
jgi:hypothetical protein